MDQQELINAGGIGAVVAALAWAWSKRAALWQWLPSFKPANKPAGETDAVAKDYEALLYLESRCGDRPPGWARGCGQIRKAFLPPLKGDGVES